MTRAASHRHDLEAPERGGIRPWVRRFAALGLVLVVLYHLVSQGLLIRHLRDDLQEARHAAEAERELAARDRANLEAQLAVLQEDLTQARAEVEALRQQLIDAGLAPSVPVEPAGAPETAPGSSGARDAANASQKPGSGPTAPVPGPVGPPGPSGPPGEPAQEPKDQPLLCIINHLPIGGHQ